MSLLTMKVESGRSNDVPPNFPEMTINLGILAPCLSPKEVDDLVADWANRSASDLMNRLREKELANLAAGERRKS